MEPTGDDFAVGIDLGTTNSVVAVARGDRVEVIPDSDGRRLHPSVVAFKPSGERLVGLPARLRRVVDPMNTIFSAKRLIGQPFRSPGVQASLAHLPYQVEEGADGEPVIATRAGRHSVIEISAYILAHLKEVAEKHVGRRVTRCVVTVPANFNDGQREATRRAGELAGFRVLRVLNEPTAAALAYGIGRKVHQRVAVFDMGGGTFDVTLLAVRESFFEVLATGGDPFLGGDDMDKALADFIPRDFLARHRIDLRADPKAFALLRIAGEQVKAKLSADAEVSGTLNDVAVGGEGKPLSLEFRVTRDQFEALVSPLVDRAIVKCEDVLGEAGVRADHVDEVILVGGATRVPLVRARVAEHFGKEPRLDINPMEVVAEGAALQAAMLGASPDAATAPGGLLPTVLVDVTPHALGLAMAGGYTDVLIDKNEAVPVERTRTFSTAREGQTEVLIRVCQGAERAFADNTYLGEVRLDGLRSGRRGEVQIEVTFLVDADGILQVSARDAGTGRAAQATLRVEGIEPR